MTGWGLVGLAIALLAACGNPKPAPKVDPNATPT
jgi:hypothetical protein